MINIRFQDGSWAVGPFLAPQSDNPDLNGLHRYDLRHAGRDWFVYHNAHLNMDNEIAIRRWVDRQAKSLDQRPAP